MKFTKPEFIGREALHRQAQGGPVSSVVLFSLDDRRIARQGAIVYSGETPVGEVLSGTQSPVLGKPIGTALVAAGAIMIIINVIIAVNVTQRRPL